MIFDWMQDVPEILRSDAARLADTSPLFTSLMRTANAEECRVLFRSEAEAILPDAGSEWVTSCESRKLG